MDDTEPLDLVAGVSDNPLIPYKLSEMSPDSLRRVRELITAFDAYEKWKQEKRGGPPQEYRERFHVFKLFSEEAAPLATFVAVITVIVILLQIDVHFDWLTQTVIVCVALIVMSGCIWYGYRVFYHWKYTFVYSNIDSTGIQDAENIWLLLNGDSAEVSTISVGTLRTYRSKLVTALRLNMYTITLDTPSEADGFLHGLRFVRNPKQLTATVKAVKNYHRGHNT